MQYIGRVNVFQSAKYLINEILNMIDGKRLFTVDYAMQVSFHQVLHDIYILELFRSCRWRNDVNNADHLYNIKISQPYSTLRSKQINIYIYTKLVHFHD